MKMPMIGARFLKTSGVFFLVVAVCLITFYATITYFLGSAQQIVVPGLVGKDVTVALEQLSELDINIRVDKLSFSERFEKGQVIAQKPPAGRKMKKGRAVYIEISRGLNRVPMPKLTLLEKNLAVQLLRNNGLTVQRLLSSCSNLDEGLVLAQTPPAFVDASRNQGVELVVSSGSCERYFVMPEFRTFDFVGVTNLLKEYGITYLRGEFRGGKQRQHSPGSIANHRPSRGEIVASGDITYFEVYGYDERFVDNPMELRYVRSKLPYGLLQGQVSVQVYDDRLTPVRLMKKAKPGENVEWVVPIARGLLPQVYYNEKLVEYYSIVRIP
jgi:serine/threonine-protein kinase